MGPSGQEFGDFHTCEVGGRQLDSQTDQQIPDGAAVSWDTYSWVSEHQISALENRGALFKLVKVRA